VSGFRHLRTWSALKSLIRYKFTAGRFSGGFTAEKDAGEKLFSGNPPLPDFLSANLAWTGNGIVRKVIIGDFGARFGMGAGVNTGLRTGLSLTQSGYLSGSDEIRPYTSTDENIFFRGTAVQIQIKQTGLSLFYSINRIDATVAGAGTGSEPFIETFYRSGLHNTVSSEEKKDAVTEYCYGINILSDFNNFRLGLLWTASRFSIPVKGQILTRRIFTILKETKIPLLRPFTKLFLGELYCMVKFQET
jgi:hypothetical protein